MLILAAFCAFSLIVIWFGYPLAVAALATFRKPAPRTFGPRKRHVSVIIATLDPPDAVKRRVADLLTADHPPDLMDIVVALDASGATRADMLGDLGPSVRVVNGHEPGGKAATLNAAVAASSGEVLVFADAAQRFEVDTIRKLSESLDDSTFGAVSGALQIGSDGVARTMAERYWKFEKWLRDREARLHSAVGVTGAVYAMQRSCWLDLPAGVILDDVYGPMQLVLRGYRVGFRADARAFDERRFAPTQEYRRKARTLTGVVQLCVWLPAVLSPRRNPIWAQFVFHKLLRLATPYLLLVMLLAFGVWIFATISATAPTLALKVMVAALAATMLLIGASRRLREGLSMVVAMQAAVVRATANGLRGRWDVWSR